MSGIARDEVVRIVSLARLSMTDSEIDRMQSDLAAILSYVESLAGLDTTGVEPTAHVIPLATPMRDDLPVPAMDPGRAVANAPEASNSAFVVPKVIAGEEEG
jgi:aspartyl-tRNA(Asn)/glutamyl-tRNA(Gln) amidotransferase subunit C